jgi:TIGR03009 family protein
MAVPFVLTPEEEAVLDMILRRWQADSSRIESLSCEIEVWEEIKAFAKKTHKVGELRYQKPDKGQYYIKNEIVEGPEGPKMAKAEKGPHWACDGKAIYEFRFEDKVLKEMRLPPHMQGQALVHSPLPFLFGAQAEELKRRYFLKDTSSEEERQKGQLWLLAFPKYQADAANFIKAEIILTEHVIAGNKLLLPYGLKLFMPNGQGQQAGDTTSHVFRNYDVNRPTAWRDWLAGSVFSPRTPVTWRREVEEPPPEAGPPAATTPKKSPRFLDQLKFGGRPQAAPK